MSSVQTQSELMIGINNAMVPKEGPKTIPVNVDLRTAVSALVDLTNQQMQQKISFIQSLWVDNSQNTAEVLIQADTSNQVLRIPAGAQVYTPILLPIPPRVTVSSVGAVIIPIQFLNVPMPYGAIGTPSPFSFGPGGELLVSDTALDNLIEDKGGGNALDVNVVYTVGGSGGGATSYTKYGNQLGGAGGATTYNIYTGAPRFILHHAAIYVSPFCYMRSGVAGTALVEILDESGTIISVDIGLPAAAPAAAALAGGLLYDFPDLDTLSGADGNRLRIRLSADVGTSSAGIFVTLAAKNST